MSYKVVAIDPFKKGAKRLIKKYPSLLKEISELGEQLSETTNDGDCPRKFVL